MMVVDQIKSTYMLEQPENTEMPKSENSTVAVNQQGRPLAYVIGVYFGDGMTTPYYRKNGRSDTKNFRLEVIDQDFRDYTADCLRVAFPEKTVTHYTNKKSGKMYYGVQVCGIGNYIESITGVRKFVPNFIYESDEAKMAFIEGLLDSEGFVQVAIGKKGTSVQANIGFAITSEVVHELKKMLDSLGVITGKISTYTKDRKLALKQLNINVRSFIQSGLQFHICRKQARIEGYEMILRVAEIASSISRNIYNGSLREHTVDSFKEMICSELCGNTKSLAEMPRPCVSK